MAGRPKHTKLLAALLARSREASDEDATELDYVLHWLRNGGTILSLASSLEAELGESISRSFLSGSVHRLAPDAKEQIVEARRDGAHALIEETVTIADNAPATANDAHKAKISIGVRQWMAERYNRQEFGNTRPDVVISFHTLHLDAMRQRALPATAKLLAGETTDESRYAE